MSNSVSNRYASAHDPLCPAPTDYWRTCCCDLIAKAHRRGFLFGWGEGHEQGRIDMLTKCIAAVEAIPEDMNSSAEWDRDYDVDETGQTRNPRIWVREATAALNALISNDSVPDPATGENP